MGRIGYSLLVLAGIVVGLGFLAELLWTSAGDLHDLTGTLGWWGLVIFLAWPALMTCLVWRDRR